MQVTEQRNCTTIAALGASLGVALALVGCEPREQPMEPATPPPPPALPAARGVYSPAFDLPPFPAGFESGLYVTNQQFQPNIATGLNVAINYFVATMRDYSDPRLEWLHKVPFVPMSSESRSNGLHSDSQIFSFSHSRQQIQVSEAHSVQGLALFFPAVLAVGHELTHATENSTNSVTVLELCNYEIAAYGQEAQDAALLQRIIETKHSQSPYFEQWSSVLQTCEADASLQRFEFEIRRSLLLPINRNPSRFDQALIQSGVITPENVALFMDLSKRSGEIILKGTYREEEIAQIEHLVREYLALAQAPSHIAHFFDDIVEIQRNGALLSKLREQRERYQRAIERQAQALR